MGGQQKENIVISIFCKKVAENAAYSCRKLNIYKKLI